MRSSVYVLLSTALTAFAVPPLPSYVGVDPANSNATKVPGTLAHFDQLIDHANPSLGTFKQRYWWYTDYYKGPGSPVIMMTPGEISADGYQGYLTNQTLNGLVAQEVGAATILLEHRYWGTSSPYTYLSTANMSYLTLENNIQDLTYFANNVKLPFAKSATNAKDVPWVLIGGSYSGALTAWTFDLAPGTFWTGLATSGPVQAISNFWEYFTPVQAGMPQNCSTDVNLVLNHIDSVFAKGSASEVTALKKSFGLEAIEHPGDFGAAIENGPWLWQERQFFLPSAFFTFCDYVENAENATNTTSPSQLPGAGGVGLTKALAGYAKWFSEVYLPGSCAAYNYPVWSSNSSVGCYNTYNADSPFYTDRTLNNTIDLQWYWMLCNQPFGYWQDGAPAGQPTLASRYVTAQYSTRQCELFFPKGPQGQTYGLAEGRTETDVNNWTQGWFITNVTRLVYTNGQFDPWRDATVSSTYRPGGPLQSTARLPVNMVPDGGHCTDLLTQNGLANPGVKAVQDAEISQLVGFLKEWPGSNNGGWGGSNGGGW